MKQLNLLASFLLELAMLFLFAGWGYRYGGSPFMKYTFAILLPVIVILLWGVFAAPKSARRLNNPVRAIFKLTLFALAAISGYQAGRTVFAVCFAAITVANVALAYLYKQDY